MTIAGAKRNREGNDAARIFVERMIHRVAGLGFLVGKERLATPPPGSLQIDKLLCSNSRRGPSYPLPADVVRTAILNGGRDAIIGGWLKLVADRERLAERSAALTRLNKLRKAASAVAAINLQGLSEGQGLVAPADFNLGTFEARMREIKDLSLMLSTRLEELQTPRANQPTGENVLRRAYTLSVSRYWSEQLGPWPQARSGWYVDILVAGWNDLDFPRSRGTDLYQSLGKALDTIGNLTDIQQY